MTDCPRYGAVLLDFRGILVHNPDADWWNFHVGLRPHLSANRIGLDTFVISFEHGFQKPDPRMFTMALEALGVGPREA